MLLLFLKFAKFGVLCFGGGYMIIPLLFDEYVSKMQFFNLEEFGNLLSISQLTPGAVSVNTATYVGFLQAGVLGAVCATLGLIFPTFVLAMLVLSIMKKYKKSLILKGLVQGGKFAAVVMLGYAMILFAQMSILKMGDSRVQGINFLELIVFLLTVLLASKTKISMIKILLIALVFGCFSEFIVQLH